MLARQVLLSITYFTHFLTAYYSSIYMNINSPTPAGIWVYRNERLMMDSMNEIVDVFLDTLWYENSAGRDMYTVTVRGLSGAGKSWNRCWNRCPSSQDWDRGRWDSQLRGNWLDSGTAKRLVSKGGECVLTFGSIIMFGPNLGIPSRSKGPMNFRYHTAIINRAETRLQKF